MHTCCWWARAALVKYWGLQPFSKYLSEKFLNFAFSQIFKEVKSFQFRSRASTGTDCNICLYLAKTNFLSFPAEHTLAGTRSSIFVFVYLYISVFVFLYLYFHLTKPNCPASHLLEPEAGIGTRIWDLALQKLSPGYFQTF